MPRYRVTAPCRRIQPTIKEHIFDAPSEMEAGAWFDKAVREDGWKTAGDKRVRLDGQQEGDE